MEETFCYKLGYKNGRIYGKDNAEQNAKFNCIITRFVNVKCNTCYTIGFSEGYYEGYVLHKKEDTSKINYWQEYENSKYLLNLKHSENCTTNKNKIDHSLYNESSDLGASSTEWNDSGYFD